jgi:anti-sigma factor RsiW
MMNCKHHEQNAIPLLDGKLAPPARRAVEEHLAACASCRERIQGFSSVLGLLGDWHASQPYPFFLTRLAARLKEEPVTQGWWQTLWQDDVVRPFRPAGRPVFAFALAVVMVVATVVLQYSPAPLDSEQPGVTLASASADDLPLYQELPLLEDYEVLRNFEVLQVLGNTNQAVQ